MTKWPPPPLSIYINNCFRKKKHIDQYEDSTPFPTFASDTETNKIDIKLKWFLFTCLKNIKAVFYLNYGSIAVPLYHI